tara:strand:+ start:106 stop:408 length:303 start_codon:yes stop_codon:yes gene_type:complete
MRKIFFSLIILSLILVTTFTKKSTKNLDEQIYKINESINSLENRYEFELLEYHYLSSPKKLKEYQLEYFESDLEPIDKKRINKISVINNDIIFYEKGNNE